MGRVTQPDYPAGRGLRADLAAILAGSAVVALSSLSCSAGETERPAPALTPSAKLVEAAARNVGRGSITNPGTPVGPGTNPSLHLQLSLPSTMDKLGRVVRPARSVTIELPANFIMPEEGATADIPLSIGMQGGGSIKAAGAPAAADHAQSGADGGAPKTAAAPIHRMVVSITPARPQTSATQAPVPSANFLNADSGLTDCGIPFEALRTKSPTCQNTASLAGRRCEQYSPSQFPEVVAINTETQLCSGTLIAKKWVITAAHCFGGDEPASEQTRLRNGDWTVPSASLGKIHVYVSNAFTLQTEQDRTRGVTRIVGYRNYGGLKSTPPYVGDIALVEISSAFPDSAVQSAELAQRKDLTQAVTLAGYGYSNAGTGTFDEFNVTWPDTVSMPTGAGQIVFNPAEETGGKSAFCQGDSGGPVFAGRYRGCKANDQPPERRPRLLEGLISYRGSGDSETGNANQRHANSCMNASLMAMQDITNVSVRKWICATTSNAAGNCP